MRTGAHCGRRSGSDRVAEMAAVALPLGLTVLQVGPLYNNHLSRWASNAAAIGCRVHAAGHLKPGRRPARLLDVAETVDVVPSEYGEEARLRWLDEVIALRRPDVIQAHWLPTWGYVAVRCAERPVAVTAWGSDLYLATRPSSRDLGLTPAVTATGHSRPRTARRSPVVANGPGTEGTRAITSSSQRSRASSPPRGPRRQSRRRRGRARRPAFR